MGLDVDYFNGINLSSQTQGGRRDNGESCNAGGPIPATARDSVARALCFTKKLGIPGREVQLSFYDTLGYILLQLGDVGRNALDYLEKAATGENLDILFRLFAVAENASGNSDAALRDMRKSIRRSDIFQRTKGFSWRKMIKYNSKFGTNLEQELFLKRRTVAASFHLPVNNSVPLMLLLRATGAKPAESCCCYGRVIPSPRMQPIQVAENRLAGLIGWLAASRVFCRVECW